MCWHILAINHEDEVSIYSRGGKKHYHEFLPHTTQPVCMCGTLQCKQQILLSSKLCVPFCWCSTITSSCALHFKRVPEDTKIALEQAKVSLLIPIMLFLWLLPCRWMPSQSLSCLACVLFSFSSQQFCRGGWWLCLTFTDQLVCSLHSFQFWF